MQAQFASGTLTALQRVELLQELEQVSTEWTGTEGPNCRLEGTLPMAWQQRAGGQRCSFPLPQAHERIMENRTATARESVLKVRRCCCVVWDGRSALVWVCSSSPAGPACPDGGGRRGRSPMGAPVP